MFKGGVENGNINTRIPQPLKHSSNISIQRLYRLSPFSAKMLGNLLQNGSHPISHSTTPSKKITFYNNVF